MEGYGEIVDRIRKGNTPVLARVAVFFAFLHLLFGGATVGFLMVRSEVNHGTFHFLSLDWMSAHGHSLIFGWLSMVLAGIACTVLPRTKEMDPFRFDRTSIAISCLAFGGLGHLICLPLSHWVGDFGILHVRMTAGLVQVVGLAFFCLASWDFIQRVPEDRVSRFEKLILLGSIWLLVGLVTEMLLWLFSQSSAVSMEREPQSFFVLRHLELEGGLLLITLGLIQPIYCYIPPKDDPEPWVPPLSQWTMWGIILAVFALNLTSIGPDEVEVWVSRIASMVGAGDPLKATLKTSICKLFSYCIPLAIGLEIMALVAYFGSIFHIRKIARTIGIRIPPHPFTGPRLLFNTWIIVAHLGFFFLAAGLFSSPGGLSRMRVAILNHLFGVGALTTISLYLIFVYRILRFDKALYVFYFLWGTIQVSLIVFLVGFFRAIMSDQPKVGSGIAMGSAIAGGAVLAISLVIFSLWGMALAVLGGRRQRVEVDIEGYKY